MNAVKSGMGKLVSAVSPQADFTRALFILGHMRCGSTALSHILCSRADVSGYGEAHIDYAQTSALGVLTLNQWRRGCWQPRARHLFDKILHNRYDALAVPEFFAARAIFIVRSPAETIASIRTLFATLGSHEYASDAHAADYYAARLAMLLTLWDRFPVNARVGVTHAALTQTPDAELARISARLAFDPALTNRYRQPTGVARRGAGDPLASHRFDRIVAADQTTSLSVAPSAFELPAERIDTLNALYQCCCATFAAG